MKIIKQFTIVILLVIIFSISMPQYSNAINLENIIDSGNGFLSSGNKEAVFDQEKETEAIDSLYWIALGIGIAVAIIAGVVLGIQFITSGATGQAKVKEKFIPFAIGCVVVFGAFGIWGFTLGVLRDVFPEETQLVQLKED